MALEPTLMGRPIGAVASCHPGYDCLLTHGPWGLCGLSANYGVEADQDA